MVEELDDGRQVAVGASCLDSTVEAVPLVFLLAIARVVRLGIAIVILVDLMARMSSILMATAPASINARFCSNGLVSPALDRDHPVRFNH